MNYMKINGKCFEKVNNELQKNNYNQVITFDFSSSIQQKAHFDKIHLNNYAVCTLNSRTNDFFKLMTKKG